MRMYISAVILIPSTFAPSRQNKLHDHETSLLSTPSKMTWTARPLVFLSFLLPFPVVPVSLGAHSQVFDCLLQVSLVRPQLADSLCVEHLQHLAFLPVPAPVTVAVAVAVAIAVVIRLRLTGAGTAHSEVKTTSRTPIVNLKYQIPPFPIPPRG